MRSTETHGKTLFKSFLNVGKSLLNTQTHSYDKTMFFIVLQEDRSSQTTKFIKVLINLMCYKVPLCPCIVL